MRSRLIALLAVIALATALALGTASAAPKPPPVPYTLGQEIVVAEAVPGAQGTYTTVRVECPAGKVVTGGGHQAQHLEGQSQPQPLPEESYPDTPSSWTVTFTYDAYGQRAPVRAYAVCVNA